MRPQLVQRQVDHADRERLPAALGLPEQFERDQLGAFDHGLSLARIWYAPGFESSKTASELR